ncbi:unnamed protein product, partial [Mesorhabditis belari]|uniref:Uncharacterized protein n=1 Tax=Mesorhabditis belari TaxID=2138241 RepID=A0AAF3J2Z1_9BILA
MERKRQLQSGGGEARLVARVSFNEIPKLSRKRSQSFLDIDRCDLMMDRCDLMVDRCLFVQVDRCLFVQVDRCLFVPMDANDGANSLMKQILKKKNKESMESTRKKGKQKADDASNERGLTRKGRENRGIGGGGGFDDLALSNAIDAVTKYIETETQPNIRKFSVAYREIAKTKREYHVRLGF